MFRPAESRLAYRALSSHHCCRSNARFEQMSSSAREIMAFSAFLQPDTIPISIFLLKSSQRYHHGDGLDTHTPKRILLNLEV